ncbi:phosphohistidine phosphatase SixA [Pseudaeromonas sharmana]|uniref:Phosphohistidine phosphatase SixA n=1 Tax=Pseudaeromonas sharmana TaxID=328412 RepID=A0ABV8CPV8_9GAMM
MKVVVMRHGDAVFGADSDANRALTEMGRQQSRAMALWLQPQLSGALRVLVSPYLRAQQTWQTIADLFPHAQVETVDELVPHGHAASVADFLCAIEPESEQCLIISHLPLVGYLVASLCPGVNPPMFVTSAMVGITLTAGRGQLEWQQAPQR